MRIISIIAFIYFLTGSLFASYVIRGGGKVCLNHPLVSYDRFLLETKHSKFFFAEMDDPSLQVFNRLYEQDPSLSNYLESGFFSTYQRIIEGEELVEAMVFDDSNYFYPKECQVAEVIQFTVYQGNTSFKLHRRIWNRLSELDQTLLVLHELFYQEMLSCNKNGSEIEASMTARLIDELVSGGDLRRLMQERGLGCHL